MNSSKRLVISSLVAGVAILLVLGMFLVFTGGIRQGRTDVDDAGQSVANLFTPEGALAAGVTQADIDSANDVVNALPAHTRSTTDLATKVEAAQEMLVARDGISALITDDGVLRDNADPSDAETVKTALQKLSLAKFEPYQNAIKVYTASFENAQDQLTQVTQLNKSIDALFVDNKPVASTTRETADALATQVATVPNQTIRADLSQKLDKVKAAITQRENAETENAKKLEDARLADEQQSKDEAAKQKAEEAKAKAEQERKAEEQKQEQDTDTNTSR